MSLTQASPQSAPTGAGRATPRRKPSAWRRAYRRIDQTIVAIHRWIGVGTCVLFVIWFATGLVVLSMTSPKLTELEAAAALSPLDLEQVRIGPSQALALAGQDRFPQDLRLEMSAGRPVYQVTPWSGRPIAVSATEARRIERVSPDQAVQIAAGLAPGRIGVWEGLIESDQWTYQAAYDAQRPFHLVAFDDPRGAKAYVSARTGRLVLETTAAERFWTWLGRIPHVFDVSLSRSHPLLWRQLLLWSVGLSVLISVSGMWLGLVRLSLRRRYAGDAVTPFRGWMKWHHILGVIGGVMLLAWVVSAFIYLRPNHLLERRSPPKAAQAAYLGHATPDFPVEAAALLQATPTGTRSLRFSWVAGEPILVASDGEARLTVRAPDGAPTQLSADALAKAATALASGSRVGRVTRLERPDEYWHDFKLTDRKLPILRVEMLGPGSTWFHIDPSTGEVLNTLHDSDRTFRWVFNGLHKFDFYALEGIPWLRQILVWSLMLVGLAFSGTGVVIGWRRLTNPRRRKTRPKPTGATPSRRGVGSSHA